MPRFKDMDLTGWGRALRGRSEVARPERQRTVQEIMADGPAPAIGQRRSYGDACLNDGGRAVAMERLDRLVAFDEETGLLSVEGGARIGEINRIMAPRGWLVPVMPGTGFATVGGAIANDVHGKNHHHAGSFGEHVAEMSIVTPKGLRDATPDAEKELFSATMGGLGQTGIVARATLQMKRAKGDVIVVTERRVKDWDDHIARLDASDATYSVGWIDATATGASLGRGILEEAETGGGLVPAPKRGRKVPFDAPAAALSAPVVRAFNALYWRRVPASGRTVVRPVEDFFFPLDKLYDWNRLYGKSGFHQFQCVVPLAEVDALRAMLEDIARSGMASPLAVLKRMGPGRAGMMSFPMEGYTLAVDLHAAHHPEALVARLEEMTAKAGGRIYLAKDSLATAAAVHAMYPERADWARIVAKYDPDGTMATDLIRRLNLREIS